jgi:hypothetical protein
MPHILCNATFWPVKILTLMKSTMQFFELLSKKLHTYLSTNFLALTKEGASATVRVSMDSLYPMEFSNTLQFSGIANHKLKLKVGVPILLLRNLNQSIGFCNGTRLIVKRLG